MSEPAQTVKMPQLGESVTEGTIARWLKSEGDEIELDEPIVEIDTDKVSSELPSPLAGRLEEILVSEGETVDVGVEIARFAQETASNGSAPAMESPTAGPTEEFPAAGTVSQPVTPVSGESPSALAGGPSRAGNGTAAPASVSASAEELRLSRSSPVVRRLASEHGVDISTLSGTGVGGRVTKKDLESHLARTEEYVPPAQVEEQTYFAPPTPSTTPPETAVPQPRREPRREPQRVEAGPGDEVVPLSGMRRAIANRMSQSKREAPHAWTMVECDVTGLVALREAKKAAFREREGVSLTYLPFIVRSVVESLKDYPVVNSVWGEDGIVLKGEVNIGVAVDVEDGADSRNGALVVPVIRESDGYNVTGLARKTSEMIKKARGKQLSPDDLAGGTFTVNNPGALGSVVSVPIINHPQAAILSAEAIVKRPVVLENDAIAVRSMMNLEISFDHRVFDGGIALRFLNAVKSRLESYGPGSEI